MDESPPLLSIKDAARRLGVDPRTLTRWINDNSIRAVRLGARWRVPHAEIERVLAAREEGAR